MTAYDTGICMRDNACAILLPHHHVQAASRLAFLSMQYGWFSHRLTMWQLSTPVQLPCLPFIPGIHAPHKCVRSGQKAALAGGTTFHIDFATPLHGDLVAGIKNYLDKAKIAIMDYGFHLMITEYTDKVNHWKSTAFWLYTACFFKGTFVHVNAELVISQNLRKAAAHCRICHAVFATFTMNHS